MKKLTGFDIRIDSRRCVENCSILVINCLVRNFERPARILVTGKNNNKKNLTYKYDLYATH